MLSCCGVLDALSPGRTRAVRVALTKAATTHSARRVHMRADISAPARPTSDWHRDLPDHRDFTAEHDQVLELLAGLKTRKGKSAWLPERVDWRDYFGPVDDQKHLATSTAHAGIGLVKYFERR